jgi:preprotein translocase subunit SecY
MIIFAGIITRWPDMISTLVSYVKLWTTKSNIIVGVVGGILVVAVFILIIAMVVFIQMAERRIPIQYAKKVVGRKMYGGQSTYLPIKVNQAGVIPVIFAMSIVSLPPTIVSLFGAQGKVASFFTNFSGNPLYYITYGLLILGFTFFYSTVQFNPIEVANNLQKNGGFIPGIRPGRPTSDFILIVLLPTLLSAATNAQGIWFGGTAVLIVVSVAIDLVNQLESQMIMRHYKGFLD